MDQATSIVVEPGEQEFPVTPADSVTPNNGFEGREKKLEIDFDSNFGPKSGLLSLSRADWVPILDLAQCTSALNLVLILCFFRICT